MDEDIQEPILPEIDYDEYVELYGGDMVERQAEMDEALLWGI